MNNGRVIHTAACVLSKSAEECTHTPLVLVGAMPPTEHHVSCRGLTVGFLAGMGFATAMVHFFETPRRVAVVTHATAWADKAPAPTPVQVPDTNAEFIAHGKHRRRRRYRHKLSGSMPEMIPTPTPAPKAAVAACIGGLLSLDIIGQGQSVRLGVIDPLQPDVFVAGTLNATQAEFSAGATWQRRVDHELEHITALRPFAAVSIEPQPTAAELLAAIRRSGYGELYEKQISGPGAGKLRPTDADPRLWLPTMLAPALGNPSGNVRSRWLLPSYLLQSGLPSSHLPSFRQTRSRLPPSHAWARDGVPDGA